MTPDDFTTAARKEAQRVWLDTGLQRYDLAVHMAEWARDRLTTQEDDGHDGWCGCGCQEPTEEEVEAACAGFYNDPSGITSWAHLVEKDPEVAAQYRSAIRRALSAARRERHEEER